MALAFELYKSVNGLPISGEEHLTKVSTAITAGNLVSIDTNGYVVHAAAGDRILGIAGESKSSSLATTTPILIHYIKTGDIVKCTTSATTPAQTDVGETFDIVSGAGSVDPGTSSANDVACWNLFDSTHVLATFLKTYL